VPRFRRVGAAHRRSLVPTFAKSAKVGHPSLVDACDYNLLSCFRWRALRVRHTWYAVSVTDGKREMYMHDLILEAGGGQQVDHINGNGLDNRRCNLRPTTHALNQANKRRVWSASKYKGVTRRGGNRWRAYITVAGQFMSLGSFDTPEDAAQAYDMAAIEHFGEFACTNRKLGLLLESLPPG
jgi:hypothetical protein